MTKKLGVFIKNASREPVVQSFKVIKDRYLPQSKLIANSNQLKSNALSAIIRHHDSTKSFQLRSNDVNTYIGASSISHLLDGWGYLSQAVNALLNGNNGAAIHLAYYAELRAVMSLLASEGVGVFNNKHIGLKNETDFSLFIKRKIKNEPGSGKSLLTHVFAWDAFEKWCRSDVKPSYDLLRLFRVKGNTFSDLLPGFHPRATQLVSSSIAKDWLKQWAFDVKKYKSDRELRNFVSYRPQTISGFDKQLDFKSTIKNVYGLFQVLSQSASNPFDYLDKLLLKTLFDELYIRPEISSRGNLFDLINDSFTSVGATLDATTQRILLSGLPNNQSHLIFSEAAKNKVEPLPIISRAALLLRVSTGSTSMLLEDAHIGKDELNFVWENYGFNNGFWETAKPVSEFYELWTEIETEYSELSNAAAHLSNSSFTVRNELEEDLNKLSQFNRACLWGI
nr:hypothetical protein [Bacteroidota bacterium]